MDIPIHIDTISMGLPHCVLFGGHRYNLLDYDIFLSLFVVVVFLILANSADPGEMLHYAAFHRGLNCLPCSYHLGGFQ